MRLRTGGLAVVLLGLGIGGALGWGPTGHRIIGELAIRGLPGDVPAFLRTPDAAIRIGRIAQEPDRWRNSGETHDAERDPGHFVHARDDGTVMGGPPLDALPPTREAYDTALRQAGSDQYQAGYLPYAIVDGWLQLRTDFAWWRVDVAGEKFAATAAERAWFATDRKLREMLTIRDLGVLAHYVGDASQPMHISVHYDGWGDYPNPAGFTQAKGVHWRFEGPFVKANVGEADVAPRVPPYRDCACAIEARTAAYLRASLAQVVPLYGLEKANAFDGTHPAGKAFAVERLAAGTAALRDMIVDAWRSSATVKIGIPLVAVSAAQSGDLKALASLRDSE